MGVLDKDSGQMEVYNAEIFNMQPLLSGRRILPWTPAAEFIPLAWRKGHTLHSPSKALHDVKNKREEKARWNLGWRLSREPFGWEGGSAGIRDGIVAVQSKYSLA